MNNWNYYTHEVDCIAVGGGVLGKKEKEVYVGCVSVCLYLLEQKGCLGSIDNGGNIDVTLFI